MALWRVAQAFERPMNLTWGAPFFRVRCGKPGGENLGTDGTFPYFVEAGNRGTSRLSPHFVSVPTFRVPTFRTSQSTQTYDALGNMVEQSFANPPWVGQYLYDENGYDYGFSHPTSVGWIYIPLPGGGSAVYSNGIPADYYVHADWLGSGRLSSTQTAPTTVTSDIAFAPFASATPPRGTPMTRSSAA
jgi:hypothetical protein